MTTNHTTIGYARVSTAAQSPELQHQALTQAGCYQIYSDTGVTGRTMIRPQLTACLEAHPGRACCHESKEQGQEWGRAGSPCKVICCAEGTIGADAFGGEPADPAGVEFAGAGFLFWISLTA